MQQLMERLKASYELECSPVAYVVALIEQYLSGEIGKQQYDSQYKEQTLSAQFFFRYMPKEHIQENLRLFAKEFAFGDALNEVGQNASKLSEDDFRAALIRCVEDYLAAHAQTEK